MVRTASIALVLLALLAPPAGGAASAPEPPSLAGEWRIEGYNRYDDCTIWVPEGELTLTEDKSGNAYRGRLTIRATMIDDKGCRDRPPREGAEDDDPDEEFQTDVVVTVEGDIVTIREVDQDRSFQYRLTRAGMEFTLESCRQGGPPACIETTFRYVRDTDGDEGDDDPGQPGDK